MRAICFLTILLVACQQQPKSATRILVFSKTEGGYRHASIEAGKKMFMQLANQYHYEADTSEDANLFTSQNLSQYKAIVFLSTRGDILNDQQQLAFQQFIQNGGGFLGIHAATTTEYSWPWYNELVGAYFDGHPEPQAARYTVVDTNFSPVKHLPKQFSWFDEVYNFKSVKENIQPVITVDEMSYTGGKMGAHHPVCWYQEVFGTRSFYIGQGHFDEAYSDSNFVQLVFNGLNWVTNQ